MATLLKCNLQAKIKALTADIVAKDEAATIALESSDAMTYKLLMATKALEQERATNDEFRAATQQDNNGWVRSIIPTTSSVFPRLFRQALPKTRQRPTMRSSSLLRTTMLSPTGIKPTFLQSSPSPLVSSPSSVNPCLHLYPAHRPSIHVPT
jgi:hypothetical protein